MLAGEYDEYPINLNPIIAMTNLIRFSPVSDLRGMQHEIDRMFDSFFPVRHANGDSQATAWAPRVDVIDNDDAYLVHVDVPGVSKDNLKINYQDGVLSISGERKHESEEKENNYLRVERSYGRFDRSFKLPQSVDVDRIEAKYTDGVLTVTVPKAEESKPREISIN